ncbi:MAG TPA: phosphate ABC transporter substrate-binding protein [Euryarchaeota archaeon]|nr:phosphate ABC transporter substrate-binding protein [Euryarchaeota archaeon]
MLSKTKKTTKFLAAFGVLAVVVTAGIFAGCIGKGGGDTVTLTVAGSTTVLPIVQQCADAYMDKHDNWDIQVSGGGSSVGVRSAAEKTADIGMSSRDVKASEFAEWPSLEVHIIAADGLAVIVHNNNPVDSLSTDHIKKIYTGIITNWQEVGGANMPIVVVGRDSNSGTRASFEEIVLDKELPTSSMLEKNSNGAVKETVAQTPGAIGYVGLGYLDNSVTTVAVDDVIPTTGTVLDGSYPIARNLFVITNGEAKGPIKEFIDFMLSKEGQKIVKDEGFIPVGPTA